MNSMELSNYLERIRLGRKITQAHFIDGIVSRRQYQRYRSGISEIPYEKIDEFANKLGIPSQKLLSDFEREKNIQVNKINKFYNAVASMDQEKIKDLKGEIDKDIIIDQEKAVYYKHALILLDYYSKKLSKTDVVKKSGQLINFPDILKNEFYTDIEVLILSSLLDFTEGRDKGKILRRLTSLFEEQDSIMSGGTSLIYTMIVMRICKSHGSLRNFEKVIQFADMGIEKGKQNKEYYLWEYFYYYKALAYFKLKDYVKYEESLFRCYNVLHMEGNKKKIHMFTEWIEKDFSIVYHTFIMKYLKREIM